MQAFANVATAPVRRTTQGGGKTYWEFRAAESAKNEDKEGTTWYTVRVFQQEDPEFEKGDFIRVVGKLKQDVFMSREGKPMGVLVVMCYEAKKYDKSKAVKPTTVLASSQSSESAAREKRGLVENEPQAHPDVESVAEVQDADESWLVLVG
jgi:single-stranded DNA-binding protein